ncbi:SDR family oxidoreductase [Daejeonella sp. H1SJ63]|uniref:SDR family oxidoreductase n=1 Tax=Daejeonella sp. H1SJ63 TaxID=3034145 RepID=UPI0023EE1B26|nr:SDR family oxidoreductase [Daejeonella sp. H1SJ63]
MDLFSLEGKVIVITGASGLLGRQHAEAIALYGGIPVLLDLNQAVLDEQALYLRDTFGVNCKGYSVNITREEAIKNNCREIIKEFGKIDGLVNNAANNPKVEDSAEKNFSRLEYFSSQIWDDDLEVGLKGSFLCLKYYGYEISRNSAGGSIVNISSDLGLIAPDQRLYRVEGLKEEQQPVKPITYSVVKTGLIGMTRYVATYWAERNVRCNAICPGGVENNQNELFMSEVRKRIPMNRMALKNEYQGLLIFLLSQASSYINGAVIAADGGRTAW